MYLLPAALLTLLLVASCVQAPGHESPPDRRGQVDGPPDTGDSGSTAAAPYRCDAPLEEPISETIVDGAVAYHGLAFHEDGWLIGWDGSRSLVAARYGEEPELFAPGVTGVEQIEHLPDGDYAVAEWGADRLARVSPEGAISTITSDVGQLYGLAVGPSGSVFIANGDVYRVDVATGTKEIIVDLPPRVVANVVDLNLDSTRLYVGTVGTGGVYGVDLDDDLNPVGQAIELLTLGSWHDALRVDACGDLWIADLFSATLYRVDGDDFSVHPHTTTPQRLYGHGLAWGNGAGGWRTDAVYMPLPYGGNQVKEVVIGVASGSSVRQWRGEPITW